MKDDRHYSRASKKRLSSSTSSWVGKYVHHQPRSKDSFERKGCRRQALRGLMHVNSMALSMGSTWLRRRNYSGALTHWFINQASRSPLDPQLAPTNQASRNAPSHHDGP